MGLRWFEGALLTEEEIAYKKWFATQFMFGFLAPLGALFYWLSAILTLPTWLVIIICVIAAFLLFFSKILRLLCILAGLVWLIREFIIMWDKV